LHFNVNFSNPEKNDVPIVKILILRKRGTERERERENADTGKKEIILLDASAFDEGKEDERVTSKERKRRYRGEGSIIRLLNGRLLKPAIYSQFVSAFAYPHAVY